MRFQKAHSRRWAGALALSGSVALGACATASSISRQEEAQMGAQYAAEINAQLPIIQNPQIHSYINQLGRSIATRVDPGLSYTFYVVNAPEVNAFAIPGGHVYINRGLIERSDNLSELAGVLGHEIGHVVERHGIEQMARAQNTNLGASLGLGLYSILTGRAPGQLEQTAVGVAAQGLVIAPHSRAAENEADEVAVQYLVQAGINPEGLVTMFQELLRERQSSPSSLEQWFSTHPLTEDRIQHVSSLVQALPASSRNLPRDNQAFQQFRQRVRAQPAAGR